MVFQLGLELRVVLQVIVEALHGPVVGAGVQHLREGDQHRDTPEQPREQLIQRVLVEPADVTARSGKARPLRMSREDAAKVALACPDPVPGLVGIDQEAEDPVAVGGAIGPGIDVDQLAGLVGINGPAGFFHRPEAAGADIGALHQIGHGSLRPRGDAVPQSGQRPVGGGVERRVPVEAAYGISLRVITDVLAGDRAGQLLPEHLEVGRVGQGHRATGQVDDAPLLQHVGDRPGAGGCKAAVVEGFQHGDWFRTRSSVV